jgi:hypothetical protein
MAAPSSWKAWRSVSVAWARMGTEVPAKLEELLAGIGVVDLGWHVGVGSLILRPSASPG